MPPSTVRIAVIKSVMGIVVCEGGVTSVGGTVVDLMMAVVVACGIGGLPIVDRGCEGETFFR